MKTAISLLCVAACVAAVQVGYVAPATSYVYRSDNGGPASLIQVGAHGYQQPQAFAPPLPIGQPLKAVEAYDLAPIPLPYVAAKPIIIEDAEEDDESSDEGSEESSEEELAGEDVGHEVGGGSAYGEEHHAAKGEKGAKGYHSQDHHAKGIAGKYGKEHKEGYFHEAKGEKGEHHDEADAHGKHHEAGNSYKGGDHGHKKHFSKGEEVTGYHKVFHKDEFKKDHDFYDVADNSGNFKKHGSQDAHHGSEAGGHKKGGHSDSGFNKGGYGKSGFHAKGVVDEADQGHSSEEGADSHYKHHEDYGKKAGGGQEKEYAFGGADGDYEENDKHDDEE
ncbi:histidine-rich protein PFHRP-II-like [Vanessa atalanta]|uniref:histidine-rich protein PFHRP-II-like n=1 Tax=Vanessa atalanta TaxID=42275 RepID=UPI001FCE0AA5|nr:histidine-rich protein PFHRP-II-like [Vanessa atalanta]